MSAIESQTYMANPEQYLINHRAAVSDTDLAVDLATKGNEQETRAANLRLGVWCLARNFYIDSVGRVEYPGELFADDAVLPDELNDDSILNALMEDALVSSSLEDGRYVFDLGGAVAAIKQNIEDADRQYDRMLSLARELAETKR